MPAGRPTKYSESYPPKGPGIYALTCPEYGDIRYIGQSVNMHHRYQRHCKNVGKAIEKTYYGNWMRSINSKPGVVVLSEGGNLDEKEKEFITKYLKEGYNLVNVSNGGDGYPNVPVYQVLRLMRLRFGKFSKACKAASNLVKQYNNSNLSYRKIIDKNCLKALEKTL